MDYIDRAFPLVELHRHLDGNVRLETILEIGLEKDLGLPATTLEELRPCTDHRSAPKYSRLLRKIQMADPNSRG